LKRVGQKKGQQRGWGEIWREVKEVGIGVLAIRAVTFGGIEKDGLSLRTAIRNQVADA